MKRRTSPVYIGVFLYRFAFLLIAVPVQAVIFEGISPDRAAYIYRADICLLLFLVVWAVIKYRSVRYCHHSGILWEESGILLARKDRVTREGFDSLTVTQGLLSRIFRVCKAAVVTARHTAVLYLPRSAGEDLYEEFQGKDKDDPIIKEFRSGFLSALIFSVGFSGALTGLLSAIPALRNTAGVIGEGQAEALVTGADLWVFIGYTALPPTLRMLSTLFFIAWAVGAAVELQRYFGLRTVLRRDSLQICRGLITKRSAVIRRGAVSAVVLSQGLLMSAMNLCNAEVQVASEGRENRLPIICAQKPADIRDVLAPLGMPCADKGTHRIKPPTDSLWGYTWPPTVFLSVCSLLCIGIDAYTPYGIEPHLALFTVLWGCAWFLFRSIAHKRSALLSTETGFIVKSFYRLTFTEAHIPAHKIRGIKLTQSIFQRRRNVCSLRLYIRGRGRQSFIIKHLNKKETAQLLDI